MRNRVLSLSTFLILAAASHGATTTAPQTSGVTAGSVTDTSATITWTSDVASTSVVQFSTTSNPPASTDPTVSDSTLVTSHSIPLTGLLAGTQYFYSVTSCVSKKACSTLGGFGFITPPVPGTWKRLGSPNVTSTNTSLTINNTLRGIVALSATNAWAVGFNNNPNGPQFAENTLIEHFDGQSWQIVPTPNTSLPQNELLAVAGSSATDIWAVGTALDPASSPAKTLILHFNGSSWTIVTSPSPDTSNNTLFAIAAISPTNAYAAGYHQALPTNTNPNPKSETLILHWDGTSWTQVASPNPNLASGFNNQLLGMTAVSATDIWAVGFSGNFQAFFEPLTLHFDGTSWNPVAAVTPSTGATGDYFSAVSAVASQDIWAVGQTMGSTSTHPVLEHWDGVQWTKYGFRFSQTTNSNFVALYSVSALASNFVWAVGEIAGSPLILQWDGTAWNQVAAAIVNASTTTPNTLQGVSAVDSNTAFAAGRFFLFTNSSQTAGICQTLAEIYSIP
jgi:hypothetical protein